MNRLVVHRPSHRVAMRFRGLSTVALLTLLSRVLGLARDAGMAVLFGAGPLLDAFSVAFRLPNLARRLFGEGALSAAFLPVFVKTYAHDPIVGRRLAWVVTGFLAGLLAASVVAVEVGVAVLWPWAGAEAAVLLELIAWLFPYVLFVCVAAQLSAVLHGREHFFWPAALPVLLNVGWLTAILLAPQWFDAPLAQMRCIAVAILVTGVIQVIVAERAVSQLGLGFRGTHPHANWEQTRPAVRDVVRTTLPTLLGLSITQLNVVLDSVLAWTFSESSGIAPSWQLVEPGTATALYLGQRLFQFPLGVFGVALGTVLFPVLAKHATAGNRSALSRDLTAGLQLCVCIGLPASLGLILLARPIPRLLFEYGSFDAGDTLLTSKMVAAYGLGVWAMIGLLIVNRAFFAVGDTRTPLRAGWWAVGVNVVLDVVLLLTHGGYGLALATSLATVIQLALAVLWLAKTVAPVEWPALRRTAAKTSAATIAMVGGVTTSQYALAGYGRLADVAFPILAGVFTFLAAAWWVRLRELLWLFRRRSE